MRLNVIRSDLAILLFVVCLPFNFIYTYLVSRAILPAIPGLIGFLTYSLLGLLVFFAPNDSKIWKSYPVSLLIVMLISIFIIILFNRIFAIIIDSETDREIFYYHSVNVLRSLTFLIIGIHLCGHSKLHNVAVWSALACGLIVLLNTNIANLSLVMPESEDLRGIYLFLGDTFAAIAIIAVAYLRLNLTALIAVSVSIIALYVIGSRTSLYAFVLAVALFFILKPNRGPDFRYGRVFLRIVCAAVIAAALALLFAFSDLNENRMLAFLVTGYDSSWAFRGWQLEEGLAIIWQNPITGSYGSDYQLRFRNGDYIHSYLEIWRQFGIFPFTLFLLSVVGAVRALWRGRGGANDPAWRAATMLMLFSGIEAAFSRTWGTPHIFAAIGMAATCCARRVGQKPIVSRKKLTKLRLN